MDRLEFWEEIESQFEISDLNNLKNSLNQRIIFLNKICTDVLDKDQEELTMCLKLFSLTSAEDVIDFCAGLHFCLLDVEVWKSVLPYALLSLTENDKSRYKLTGILEEWGLDCISLCFLGSEKGLSRINFLQNNVSPAQFGLVIKFIKMSESAGDYVAYRILTAVD